MKTQTADDKLKLEYVGTIHEYVAAYLDGYLTASELAGQLEIIKSMYEKSSKGSQVH